MRIRAIFIAIVVACLALTAPVRAAGTLTLASTTDVGNGVTRYTFTWVSTAGGAVSANAQVLTKGHLKHIEFTPDSGGTQPTDLYDVTLLNERSVDLLDSRGGNLSNASSLTLQWDPQLWHDDDDDLDIVIANAGNAKGGTVRLWIQR